MTFSKKHIGSVDPYALKIPARRAEYSLTENACSPVHAEPGQDTLVVDITADENGRFRLPKLAQGAYWLGISKYGFQLHVWDLRIVRFGWSKDLKPKLSVGT
jgi:hypothetical protein